MLKNKIKVLLIDDDISLGSIYSKGLQHLGFEVHYLSSFIAVIGAINEFQPNILVLDIEIGAKNGISESENLFKLFPKLPIIFISSHTETQYVKRAIEQGGASYLKKPFDIDELGVYINRFAQSDNEALCFGCFSYEPKSHKLYNSITEETIKLPNKESLVLLHLIKNAGNITSRAELEQILSNDSNKTSEFMLNNIISHLRKLIAVDPSINIITIPRAGHKLEI